MCAAAFGFAAKVFAIRLTCVYTSPELAVFRLTAGARARISAFRATVVCTLLTIIASKSIRCGI